MIEAVKELKVENDILKEKLEVVYKKFLGWDTLKTGTDPHKGGSFCARIVENQENCTYDDFPRDPEWPSWNAGRYGRAFYWWELSN